MKLMKKIIVSIFAVLLLGVAAYAQNITVTGKVLDNSGQPVIGAGVVVAGTSNGTVVDLDGNFTISSVAEGATITASCIGYADVSMPAAPKMTFVLNEDTQFLDEVVVVGYGSIKKSNLSGAVASVKTDELPVAGDASVGSMLRGRAAGMNITNSNAAPGAALDISIRGGLSGQSPLIIIDGVPQVAANSISSGTAYSGSSHDTGLINLNPNDIESISILKDASAAAIYGSDASGGVILVTTKRGKEGRPQISYSGSVSATWMKDAPRFLNAKDYMTEQNKIFAELGRASEQNYTQEQIDEFVGDGTNWLKEVTRTGIVHEHNLSVNAGSADTQVLGSVSYYNHQGVAKNNDMERITGRLNVDQKFGEIVTAGVNATFAQIKYNDVPLGEARHDNSPLIYSAMTFTPLVPVYLEDGSYSANPIRDIYPNPVSLLDVIDQTTSRDLNVSGYVEVRPFEGFSVKATAGVDMRDEQHDQYIPTTTKKGAAQDGQASKQNGKSQIGIVNIAARYSKVFAGRHDFSALAGWEFKKSQWEGMGIVANRFPFDNATFNNLATSAQEKPSISSYKSSNEMASFFGRINYAFDERYILTANVRVDGSSNFSPKHQWGVFPGVSAAWRINREEWMQGAAGWLSNLKLRAGIGQTGNAGYLTGINSYYAVFGNVFAPGGTLVNGVSLSNIGNSNLKWETLTDINIGFDLGFFKDRISATADLYQRTRSDVILSKSLMSYQEIRTIDYNSGDVYRTRGIDLGIHSVNIDNGRFFWSTDLNFSFYRNHTVKRDADFIPAIYQPTVEDWGNIYGYKTNGLISQGDTYAHLPNSQAGCILYQDLNGHATDDAGTWVKDREGRYIYSDAADGILDDADLVLLFNSTPIPVSLNNTFRWGNWDANIYIYGSLNGYKINEVLYQSVYGAQDMTYGLNALSEIKNRWSPENTSGTLPGVYEANSGIDPAKSDFFYEKSWYLRLDNFSLGYTFAAKNPASKFRSLRLYLSGRNLFVLTPFTGMDPETGNGHGAYPNYSSVSFGIDFKF